MKFAICNETFDGWPLDRACAAAAECGYTGLEIAPFTLADDVRSLSAAQRREIVHAIHSSGLEVVGLHWLLAKTTGFYLTTSDAQVRRATADYLRALIALCSDLGGTLMVLGSPKQRNLLPGISHDTAMRYAAEVLQAVMPDCETFGVTVAVEPLGPAEGDFLLTAASGVELCKRVDSPHCRLHLDCKAMSSEPRPIAETIRANRDWLAHFHANDPNLLGPGMGDLDFAPIMQALDEIGYDGWVSVEVFDYSPGPAEIAQRSMEYLMRHLPPH